MLGAALGALGGGGGGGAAGPPKYLDKFSPLVIPEDERSTTVALASILSFPDCTQHNLPDVVDGLSSGFCVQC